MQITVWLGDPGSGRWSVQGAPGDPEFAVRRSCFEFATRDKWTVPRWWQFWRWDDHWWSWPKEHRKALTEQCTALSGSPALCLARKVGSDEPLTRCAAYPRCPCGGPEGWPIKETTP